MRFALLTAIIIATPSCQSGAPAAGSARIVAVGAASEDLADHGDVGLDVGRVIFEEDGVTRRFRFSLEAMGTTIEGPTSFNPTDLFEASIGGRAYGDYLADLPVQPFASLQLVYAETEDNQGFFFVPGANQIGARLGAGLEWSITDQVFLDLIADYTTSLTGADTTEVFFNGVPVFFEEAAFEGYAVRLGVGVLF